MDGAGRGAGDSVEMEEGVGALERLRVWRRWARKWTTRKRER
jgi:hypothetical protein